MNQTLTVRDFLWGMRIVWRAGGWWERFFQLWPFVAAATGVLLMVWVGLVERAPYEEWQRIAPVALHIGVTFIPAHWAQESSATIRALLNAGIEHPELARLKSEYLERFGEKGRNQTAIRLAVAYVVLYVFWLVLLVWIFRWWGFNIYVFALHVSLVFILFGFLVWTFRRWTAIAESRGYALHRLALEVRRRRAR